MHCERGSRAQAKGRFLGCRTCWCWSAAWSYCVISVGANTNGDVSCDWGSLQWTVAYATGDAPSFTKLFLPHSACQ